MTNNLSQNGFGGLTAKAVRLASAVYRVTKLFPQNEVLRNQLRLKAGDIVFEMSQVSHSDKNKKNCYNIQGQIKGLKALFNIAKDQNWVKPINFEVLNREYTNLENEIDKFLTQVLTEVRPRSTQKREVGAIGEAGYKINSNNRRPQILEYLKSNGRIQIGQVCQLFPQVSRRTLIRDLDDLCRNGLAERNGGGRGIFYQIKQSVIQLA